MLRAETEIKNAQLKKDATIQETVQKGSDLKEAASQELSQPTWSQEEEAEFRIAVSRGFVPQTWSPKEWVNFKEDISQGRAQPPWTPEQWAELKREVPEKLAEQERIKEQWERYKEAASQGFAQPPWPPEQGTGFGVADQQQGVASQESAQQQEKGCGEGGPPPIATEDLVRWANEAIRDGSTEKYSNLQGENDKILYVFKYNKRVLICSDNESEFKEDKSINEVKNFEEGFSYVEGEEGNDISSRIQNLELGKINEKSLCEHLRSEEYRKLVNAKEELIEVIKDKSTKKYSNLQGENGEILYVIKYKDRVAICCGESGDFKEDKNRFKERNVNIGHPLYIEEDDEHKMEDEIKDLNSGTINKKSLCKCLGLKGFGRGIKDRFNEYREIYANVGSESNEKEVFYFRKKSKMVILDANQGTNVTFVEFKKENILECKCVSFEKMYEAGEIESYVDIYEELKGLNNADKIEQFVDKVAELLKIELICKDLSIKKVKHIFCNGDKYLYIDNKGRYNTKQLSKLSKKSLSGIFVNRVATYRELYLSFSINKIFNEVNMDLYSKLSKVLGLELHVTAEDLEDLGKVVVRIENGISLDDAKEGISFLRVTKEKLRGEEKKLICVAKDPLDLDKPEKIEMVERFDKDLYFNIFNLANKIDNCPYEGVAINYEAIGKGEIYEISCGEKAAYVSNRELINEDLSKEDINYIVNSGKVEESIEINNYTDYYNEVYIKHKGNMLKDYKEEKKVLAFIGLDLNLKKIEGCKIYAQKGISLDTKNKFTKGGNGQYVLIVEDSTKFSRLNIDIEEWNEEELNDNREKIINLATEEKDADIGFNNKVSYAKLSELEKERLINMIEFTVIPTKKIVIDETDSLVIDDNFEIIREKKDTILQAIERFNIEQLQFDGSNYLDASSIADSELEEFYKEAKEYFVGKKMKNYKIAINSNQEKSIRSNCNSDRWGNIQQKNKIDIKNDIESLGNIKEVVIGNEGGKEVVTGIDTVKNLSLKNNYKKIVFTISNYKKEMKFYEINVEKLGEKYLYIKQVEPKKGTKNLIYKDQEKVGNLVVKTLERIKYSENPEIVKGIMAKWTINEIEREILLKESGVLEIELGDGLEEIINRIENIAREVSAQTYEAK